MQVEEHGSADLFARSPHQSAAVNPQQRRLARTLPRRIDVSLDLASLGDLIYDRLGILPLGVGESRSGGNGPAGHYSKKGLARHADRLS